MRIYVCQPSPRVSSRAVLALAFFPGLAWTASGRPASLPGGAVTIAAIAAEVVTLCTGLAGLYLTGSLVFSLSQANLEVAGGRARALAEARDRIFPPVVCFVFAACAQSLGGTIAALAPTAAVPDAAGALALWRAIAEFVVRLVLLSAGAVTAVSFATGGLAAQVAVLSGRPDTLSQLWTRLLLAAATGGLTLLSVEISRWLIEIAIR